MTHLIQKVAILLRSCTDLTIILKLDYKKYPRKKCVQLCQFRTHKSIIKTQFIKYLMYSYHLQKELHNYYKLVNALTSMSKMLDYRNTNK